MREGRGDGDYLKIEKSLFIFNVISDIPGLVIKLLKINSLFEPSYDL